MATCDKSCVTSVYDVLDSMGLNYEVLDVCAWCGVRAVDPDTEMDGCCSLECRYQLACSDGFVTDTEHDQNVEEGWAA